MIFYQSKTSTLKFDCSAGFDNGCLVCTKTTLYYWSAWQDWYVSSEDSEEASGSGCNTTGNSFDISGASSNLSGRTYYKFEIAVGAYNANVDDEGMPLGCDDSVYTLSTFDEFDTYGV